jgi:thioredoxin-like negative regulator of GroEL
VIELLLEAERAITFGLLDQAERLYRQVADNDPKNSIAVVGLARVALERGDERAAYVFARRALAIDADNPAAQHLVMRLAEVMAGRGETPPPAEPSLPAKPDIDPVEPPTPGPTPGRRPGPKPAGGAHRRPGLVGRSLGRKPRS